MKFTSPVYSAVSGSIAGVTYSRNRYGMYTRARAVPVNPNTVRQQVLKSAMAAMVDYWHLTLTAAQRAAWATYAANTPVTDSLGQTQYLTGQVMFLRANILRQWRALSIISAAPTVFDLGQPVVSVTSVVVAGGVLTWTFTVGGAGTSTTCRKMLYIGVAQNAGRSFFNGPWQLAGDKAGAAATTAFTVAQTLATTTDWLAAYSPAIGNNLPIKLRLLYDDGRLTTAHKRLITVT